MGRKRQNIQMLLAFAESERGEASGNHGEGTERPMTGPDAERPADTGRLMEEVCERENLWQALKRVRRNRGSPGIDGMTVETIGSYLKEHWPAIRTELLAGTYRPQPVKRVEIPKPGGGMRKLGIPTVLDRFIQQAVMQVLQRRWDPTFSEHSYGFRPGRSAHAAVAAAQDYLGQGHRWVVDIDLEKFFDRVNHDVLMARVARRVSDKRMLRLLRAFLNAGVMENGLVGPTHEGTPQGGPLSPLLSNLLLDDLDRELQRRGLRFVRYADDCNIYVRSERAGLRVMGSITRFLGSRLKLRVNQSKSAVAQPWKRKFLGFSFYLHREPKRRLAAPTLRRFKKRIRELTRRTRGVGLTRMVDDLSRYLLGWRGYFGFCQTPKVLRNLDMWIRRRLRVAIWKQWPRGRTRFVELRKRGVSVRWAGLVAGSSRGPWVLSRSPAMRAAFPPAYFDALGLPRLASQ